MISKVTSSIKNNPIPAAIGGAIGFFASRKFLKTGILVSSLIGVTTAVIAAGITTKATASKKIVIKQEDPTK